LKINTILALSIAFALTGCGNNDSDSSKPQHPAEPTLPTPAEPTLPTPVEPTLPTPVEPTLPDSTLVTPWTLTMVESTMNSVTVIDGSNTITDCDFFKDNGDQGNTDSSITVETTDFIVAYDGDNINKNITDLKNAARLIQTGLDELIEHTGLSKADDLHITAGHKWIGCFNDDPNSKFKGSAFDRKFRFAPDAGSLDPSNAGFTDSYELTKHELFHVIEKELLVDSVNQPIPKWFSEAAAELFAGKKRHATSYLLENYTLDTRSTPMALYTYAQEIAMADATDDKYKNSLYKMYFASLEYLMTQGLTTDRLIQLIRDSSMTDSLAAKGTGFDLAMAALEPSLSLPTTYENLRDNTTDYNTHIVEEWLTVGENKAAYTDDISDDVFAIFVMKSADDEEPIAMGHVNATQDRYVINGEIPNDTYIILAMSAQDKLYGPINKTITDGKLGDLDFSGAPILILAD
jgi:hypothetical protein